MISMCSLAKVPGLVLNINMLSVCQVLFVDSCVAHKDKEYDMWVAG